MNVGKENIRKEIERERKQKNDKQTFVVFRFGGGGCNGFAIGIAAAESR
jgi:hypothetical protein